MTEVIEAPATPEVRGRADHLKPFCWQPGQSGNPAGRAKGARDKLQGDFLHALAKDFAEHGAAAIVKVRENKPDAYLRVVASLMPKQLEAADVHSVDDNVVLEAIKQKLAARAARAPEQAAGGTR